MKSSELYAIQIEGFRTGIINEIMLLLKKNNLTEIEIPESAGDAIFVIWFDKNGYPHEAQVTRVILNEDHLTVVAKDNESDSEHEMDSRYNLGARNLDWLVEIFYKTENILSKDEMSVSNTSEQ